MINRPCLEFADVKRMAAAAEAEAVANRWAVTIAIVDAGGHLLSLQRLDGAAPIAAQIAPAKARTAAIGQRESRIYEEMINNGRVSFLSAPDVAGLLEGFARQLIQLDLVRYAIAGLMLAGWLAYFYWPRRVAT